MGRHRTLNPKEKKPSFNLSVSAEFKETKLPLVAQHLGMTPTDTLVHGVNELWRRRGEPTSEAAARFSQFGVVDAVGDFFSYDFTHLLRSREQVIILVDNLEHFLSNPTIRELLILRALGDVETTILIPATLTGLVGEKRAWDIGPTVINAAKGLILNVLSSTNSSRADAAASFIKFLIITSPEANVLQLVHNYAVGTVVSHRFPMTHSYPAMFYAPSLEPVPSTSLHREPNRSAEPAVVSLKRQSTDFHSHYGLMLHMLVKNGRELDVTGPSSE